MHVIPFPNRCSNWYLRHPIIYRYVELFFPMLRQTGTAFDPIQWKLPFQISSSLLREKLLHCHWLDHFQECRDLYPSRQKSSKKQTWSPPPNPLLQYVSYGARYFRPHYIQNSSSKKPSVATHEQCRLSLKRNWIPCILEDHPSSKR